MAQIAGGLMSFNDDRAAIAAAMSTVDGLNGFPQAPSVLAPGQAWPVLGGLALATWPEVTWRVVVVLGGTAPQAEAVLEAVLDSVRVALAPVLSVDSVVPAQIQAGSGVLHAVEMVGRKEYP